MVLTGRRESAENDVDIPIPSWYKVDETEPNAMADATWKIPEILTDCPAHQRRFSPYRDWIRNQKREFEREVRRIFGSEVLGFSIPGRDPKMR